MRDGDCRASPMGAVGVAEEFSWAAGAWKSASVTHVARTRMLPSRVSLAFTANSSSNRTGPSGPLREPATGRPSLWAFVHSGQPGSAGFLGLDREPWLRARP